MKGVPSHVVGGCFAMCAFSVAVLAGLTASNGATTILIRAILAMIICYPLGWIVGVICRRAIDEHVRSLGTEQDSDADEETPPASDAGETASPKEEEEEVILV